MSTVDDLSKQILADLVQDFRAKNLGSEALSNGYDGASIVALETKYCAGPYSKVDFDLALKQLEESKLVDTGPRVPVQNPPGSQVVFVGLHHNKRQFVYLTEKGYIAAQKSTPKPRSQAPSVRISGGFHTADSDRKYARLSIDEARKSVPENDGRPHPWVGAVVVKDGKVLGTAHRGEVPGNHAEFVALERILPDVAVAGATVYTTLEPCTTRNSPKIPCVDRLIERRVARVVIGILDPDDRIRGKGQRKLSNAGIETALFPHDLAMQVEELNREFTRYCEQHRTERAKPNLQFQPIRYGNMGLENDLWLRGYGEKAWVHRVWALPVRNEPTPHDVADVQVSVQIIFTSDGHEVCDSSPAAWVDEVSNIVKIPVGATREVILVAGSVGGLWQAVTNRRADDTWKGKYPMELQPIPLCSQGELNVRLLSQGRILKTVSYKWRRTNGLEDFYIDPRAQDDEARQATA